MTAPPLQQKHAFLSYIHEDREAVDRLDDALQAAGISVWRDTQNLWPGDDWEAQIRAAIQSNSLAFISCFSENYGNRDKSYQNAELALAAEEYRLRAPGKPWLFTVRFSECDIPSFDLGAGRTLDKTIQRSDLFGPAHHVNLIRLIQRVEAIVSTPAPTSPSVAQAIAGVQAADGAARSRIDTLKLLLRDPNADIALEDFMRDLVAPARAVLDDVDAFPTDLPGDDDLGHATFWTGQVQRYEEVIEPALEVIKTAAMYGLPAHESTWTAYMQGLTATLNQHDGATVLLRLRQYPVLVLAYVAAIGAVSRNNYSSFRAFVADPTVRQLTAKRTPFLAESGVRNITERVEWIASALCITEENGTELSAELIQGLRSRGIGGRHTPMSDHLHSLLGPLFADRMRDPAEFAEAFDRAEVMMDAVAIDQIRNPGATYYGATGGYGRYTWRHRHTEQPIELTVLEELRTSGAGWTPLMNGVFGGDEDRAISALEHVVETAGRLRSSLW